MTRRNGTPRDSDLLREVAERTTRAVVETDVATETLHRDVLDRTRALYGRTETRGRKRRRRPDANVIAEIMSVDMVAEALGASESTVEAIPRAQLPYTSIGRGAVRQHRRYRGDDVRAYLGGGSRVVPSATEPATAEPKTIAPQEVDAKRKKLPANAVAPAVARAFALMRGGKR